MNTPLTSMQAPLRAYTDPKFYADSFARYTKSKADRLEEYNSMLASVELSDGNGDAPSQSVINGYIDNLCAEYNFSPDAWVPVSDGYVRIKDVIEAIIRNNNDPAQTASEAGVRCFDSLRGYLRDLPLDEVIQFTLDASRNALAMAACLEASAISSDSVSDMVAAFDAKVASISGVAQDVASIAYYKDKLVSLRNPAALLNDIFINTGAKANVDNESISDTTMFTPLSDSEACQYTGSSPVAGLDFSGVAETAGTILSVGSKILGAIVSVVRTLTVKACQVASDFVETQILDPNALIDLKPTDNNRSIRGVVNTINIPAAASDVDYWSAFPVQYAVGAPSNYFSEGQSNQELRLVADEYIKSGLDKTVYFRSIFGCIALRPNEGGALNLAMPIVKDPDHNNGNALVFYPLWFQNPNNLSFVGGSMSVIPSVINPEPFRIALAGLSMATTATAVSGYGNSWEVADYTASSVAAFCNVLGSKTDELMNTANLTEAQCLEGLIYSNFILSHLDLLSTAANYTSSSATITLPNIRKFAREYLDQFDANRDIQNLDFIQLGMNSDPSGGNWYNLSDNAAEYNSDEGVWNVTSYIPYSITVSHNDRLSAYSTTPHASYAERLLKSCSFFAMCYGMHMNEKVILPLDYGFVPFSNSSLDLGYNGYRLATDSETSENLVKALTALTIVATVAVVGATAFAVTKKITRKMAWKREQTVASLSAKMWNGEELTAKERRQYAKATKKGGVASLFEKATSGGNSTGNDNSAYNTTYECNQNVEFLRKVITY